MGELRVKSFFVSTFVTENTVIPACF